MTMVTVAQPAIKFLVNADIQASMFVGCCRAAPSTKALVAEIAKVPLSLDERFKG